MRRRAVVEGRHDAAPGRDGDHRVRREAASSTPARSPGGRKIGVTRITEAIRARDRERSGGRIRQSGERCFRMRARQRAGACAVLLLSLACGGGGGGGESSAAAAPQPPFDVAGEIQIAFASAVDGDVNDSHASYAPNDTPAGAQPLPNPVTLGGYVNVAGEGAPGRSFVAGDPFDDYRVA